MKFDPVTWIRRAKRMGYGFTVMLVTGDLDGDVSATNVMVREPDYSKHPWNPKARKRRSDLMAEINRGGKAASRRRWHAVAEKLPLGDGGAFVVERKLVEGISRMPIDKLQNLVRRIRRLASEPAHHAAN